MGQFVAAAPVPLPPSSPSAGAPNADDGTTIWSEQPLHPAGPERDDLRGPDDFADFDDFADLTGLENARAPDPTHQTRRNRHQLMRFIHAAIA
ncbi:hypothetical protein ACWGI8_06750 [Streptomyces sp. NPDC054841]